MPNAISKIRKSERTRKALLDAALSVIGRKGYTAATVDEIVREAGVSKGVAYYHFKSKEEIATSILEQEFSSLAESFKDVAAKEQGPHEVLLAMLEAFSVRLYERKELAQFFSAEMWRGGRAWSGGVRSAAQKLIDLIAAQLVRGQESGLVRTELDATFAAASIVGMVVADAMYCLGDEGSPSLTQKQFIERIYDFAHNAVVAK